MKKLVVVTLFGLSVAFGADDIQTLTKKCEANDGKACLDLAGEYYRGEKITKDYSQTFVFDKKACDLGNAAGCYEVGIMYAGGKGVAKNQAKAVEYYDKACSLGYSSGCTNAGAYYLTETQRFLTAKKYLEKGCELKSGVSCGNLGTLYLTGKGVKANNAMAQKYFKKACNELGFKPACKYVR